MDRTVELPDLAATQALGVRIAHALRRRDLVALHGTLGAGKTELARAILRTVAGDPDMPVPSPTFTLVETYDTATGTIWHFDLYRLDDPEDVWELGFEEALADGIALIEWPENLGPLLPATRLDIAIAMQAAGSGRTARLTGQGDWSARHVDLPS